MIEIAPNVFAKSWDDVARSYIHGSGVFAIDFKDGNTVAIHDRGEAQQTAERWRSIANAPFEPKAPKVPADIALWMNKRRAGRFA